MAASADADVLDSDAALASALADVELQEAHAVGSAPYYPVRDHTPEAGAAVVSASASGAQTWASGSGAYGASAQGPEGVAPVVLGIRHQNPVVPEHYAQGPHSLPVGISESVRDSALPERLSSRCQEVMKEHYATKWCCKWMDLNTALLLIAAHYFLIGISAFAYLTFITVLLSFFILGVTSAVFINGHKKVFKLGPAIWLMVIIFMSFIATVVAICVHPNNSWMGAWVVYGLFEAFEGWLVYQWYHVVTECMFDLQMHLHYCEIF